MHQSFVTTPPPPPNPHHPSHTYGEGWEVNGLKCGAITFQLSLQCRGNDIRILTLGTFSIAKGGAKSKVLTSSCHLGVELIAGHWKLKSHNPRPSPLVGEQMWLQMTGALLTVIITAMRFKACLFSVTELILFSSLHVILVKAFVQHYEKSNNLHMRKQRRRSVSQ